MRALIPALAIVVCAMTLTDVTGATAGQRAEPPSLASAPPVRASLDAAAPASASSTQAQPATQEETPFARPLLDRWLVIDAATLSTRYRFSEDNVGKTTNNQQQHNEAFRLGFKIDEGGRYRLNTLINTGRGFTSSWNNTGLGTGDAAGMIFTKQLFLSAEPIDGISASFGGIGLERGESTEISTYDNDGYIIGERIAITRPKELFFDAIVFTNAFLGDLTEPSVWKRFKRMDERNFRQILLRKKIGAVAAASLDYTYRNGDDIVDAAIRVDTAPLRVIDSVRFENYKRFGDLGAYGFAFTLTKTVLPKLELGGGYAQIDELFGGLNSDRYNAGKRIFLQSSVALSNELTLSTWFSQAFDNDFYVPHSRRFDVVLTYNLAHTLRQLHLVQ